MIVSLFLPSSFYMGRKIIINADKSQIFKQVDDFRNWKNWSPWALKDPLIYAKDGSFSDPSFGEGASFNWNSEVGGVGSGEMKTIASIRHDNIKNAIDAGMGGAESDWFFKDVAAGVEVTWSLTIDFGFNPFAKYFGLFIEGEIAPDYELGLNRLKSFCEELPKIHKVEVVKKRLEEDMWFLSIRDTVNQREMNNVHGKIYGAINHYLDSLSLTETASPLVIYHFFSEDRIDLECGIPIKDSTVLGSGSIKLNRIKTTNVVTAVHHGPYERLPETYFGINEWMRKNEVIVTGPPWELYLTDPANESNPEKWETAIYFPIE